MYRSFAKLLLVGLVSVSLIGCSAMQENPRAVKGTVIGAGGGAAAGAAIGAIVGGGRGAGQGAAIGAVVGALGGGLIGSYMDQQAKAMQGVLAEQDRLRQGQDELQVVLASDVLFESGKAYVQPGARDKLRQIASVLNRYPRTNIQIVGHTDSRGSEESNQELSLRRARAVADELAAAGVSSARISARGEGESRPVASNNTPEGRQQNRRVEINLTPDNSFQEGGGGGGGIYPEGGGYQEPR